MTWPAIASMTNDLASAATFSNSDLLGRVRQLAGSERRATAALIASLAEFDAWRLYLAEGWWEGIWKSVVTFYRPKKVFDEVETFRGTVGVGVTLIDIKQHVMAELDSA